MHATACLLGIWLEAVAAGHRPIECAANNAGAGMPAGLPAAAGCAVGNEGLEAGRYTGDAVSSVVIADTAIKRRAHLQHSQSESEHQISCYAGWQPSNVDYKQACK